MPPETPQATYDAARGPQREAAADAANIRTTLERDGAEAAVSRMRAEVDTVPERDRQAYNTALLRGLQGDGRSPNVLPDMALTFGLQNGGVLEQSRQAGERIVSATGVQNAVRQESNPVFQELYREFGTKYRALRQQNGESYNLSTNLPLIGTDTIVPESQLRQGLESNKLHVENRRSVGLLATHPDLFNGIAGSDKAISQTEVVAFQNKWNASGQEGRDFRKKFAATPEMEKKISDTVENLRLAFDSDQNTGSKPGSLLENNRDNRYFSAISSYGQMTEASLLRGLGYNSLADAKSRMPVDAGGKPIAEVTTLPNFDSTALRRGEGPSGLAQRMLQGQSEFFKDAPGGAQKALADLTTAMGIRAGNFADRQGQNQVTAEKRNDIIKAIDETGNTRLRDWFISRYPENAAPSADNRAPAAMDTASSSVVRRQGPDTVARNMLKESGLDATAQRDLARVLHKDLGVDWNTVREGTRLINPEGKPENMEMVREKVEATKNAKLIEWFNTKYPKR